MLAARLLGAPRASIWLRGSSASGLVAAWGGPPTLSAAALGDLVVASGRSLAVPGPLAERALRRGAADRGRSIGIPTRGEDGAVTGAVCVEHVRGGFADGPTAWQLLDGVARQVGEVLAPARPAAPSPAREAPGQALAAPGRRPADRTAERPPLATYAPAPEDAEQCAGPPPHTCCHERAPSSAPGRGRLAAELGVALRATGQLSVAYQPSVALRDGSLHAVEALLRWRHPVHGPLTTTHFIDVAEERELIVPLGSWVLRAACTEAAGWYRRAGERTPRVWVNVSARQLGRHQLAACVAETLRATGLPAHKLGLEVTERQALEATEPVLQELGDLTRLGCGLALDDFGTGHSDIPRLRALPVDTLKIDRTYVAGLGADRTDTALTAGMVALARALGLAVVAEGVETTAQRRLLQELGCDAAQGYLFHRPGPAAVVERLLERAAG
nr:EAL domain-containing protein [Motilibacter aurantiacus]